MLYFKFYYTPLKEHIDVTQWFKYKEENYENLLLLHNNT